MRACGRMEESTKVGARDKRLDDQLMRSDLLLTAAAGEWKFDCMMGWGRLSQPDEDGNVCVMLVLLSCCIVDMFAICVLIATMCKARCSHRLQ